MHLFRLCTRGFSLCCLMAALSACTADTAEEDVYTSFQPKPTAGIRDIMADMIDPAADFIWESVGTTISASGEEDRQPQTDAEWNEVRRQAIILTEGANLLLIPGRPIAREGTQIEDQGTAGNLTAEEAEQAIADNPRAFLTYAQALHDMGKTMLLAADQHNPQGLIDNGGTLDEICEGCHLQFWYPGQQIPAFPDQAPEVPR